MRMGAILIGVSLAFMALVPLASYNASAAPVAQLLRADGVISTDATFLLDYDADPNAYDTAHEALNMVNPDPAFNLADDATFDSNYWDDTPGCVLWGDAMSATEGNFGTAEVRYTVSNLVGDTADYYYINFKLGVSTLKDDPPDSMTYPNTPTETLSFRVGFGYTDADSGSAEYINQTYMNRSSTAGSWEQFTEGREINDIENGFEDRPFTLSEMNKLYVVLQIRFDPGAWGSLNTQSPTPINSGICFTLLQAVPTTHTPEPAQTGGFILRPDADNFAQGWENYSVDDYEGMYGALNDTTQHGDAEQSYVNATWAKSAYLGLGFTDPPSWAPDIEYRVVLWAIIRHTETGIGELHSLTMSISSAGLDEKTYYPSTSYTNNTHESLYIPGSSDYWTLTELEDIMANFWLDWTGATPSGELRMTQVAFLCVPIVSGDYVPDTGDYTDDSFRAWLTTGNGMYTLFALMGGIGLIAGAPLAIIMFKEGRKDGVGALALAVVIVFMSLCFLIVGLAPYN